jgi:hypothetical protein
MTLDTTAANTIIIAMSVVCSRLPEATVVVDVLAKWLLLQLSSLLYSEVVRGVFSSDKKKQFRTDAMNECCDTAVRSIALLSLQHMAYIMIICAVKQAEP